jgi:hypothetical protein
MTDSGGITQIIHNDLGWTKDLVAAAVATLCHLEDASIGPAWVAPHGDGLVPMGIEGPTYVLDDLNAVAVEQLAHLLQRYRHTLVQGLGRNRLLGSQSAFEIVENGQQVADEGVLFHRGLLVGIAPGTLLEIVKVGGEAPVIVLQCGQRLLEHGWVGRRSINN